MPDEPMTSGRTWSAANDGARRPALARRTLAAAAGFVLVATFFLATEHRAHLFGALPYVLLLLCPLLHLVMHGGHGGHGSGPDTGHGTGAQRRDGPGDPRGRPAPDVVPEAPGAPAVHAAHTAHAGHAEHAGHLGHGEARS